MDQDRLDLEQAFIGISNPLGGDTLRLRLGRQLVEADLQRFLSSREGPNLRQLHDAVNVDYQRGLWRIVGLYSRPLQLRDLRAFDDYSDDRMTVSGILIRRRLLESAQMSVYYGRYTRDSAQFISASGNERRDIGDIRFGGAMNGFDWDIEAMNQTGRIEDQAIQAWAFGSSVGYVFADAAGKPHLELALDAASGDRSDQDRRLETFNPLFPNGYFLPAYTGYVNLILVKPSLVLQPTQAVKLTGALAAQWRMTTADAVYMWPSFPVVGSAGTPGRYTGTSGRLRGEWTVTPNSSFALEAVHYAIGNAIRKVGGRDANYVSLEFKTGW